MVERPILFLGPMVRSILAGTKTMTRRVVNFPANWGDMVTPNDIKVGEFWNACQGDYHRWQCGDEFLPRQNYQIGDRLWVKETWALYQTVNRIRYHNGRASSEVSDGMAAYRADGHLSIEDLKQHIRLISGIDLEAIEVEGDCWRSPIHMPRWASRLNLLITGVRAERVQEIAEADARAEGLQDWYPPVGMDARPATSNINRFANLWDSINEKRGYGWDKNPWVWVIEFEREEG